MYTPSINEDELVPIYPDKCIDLYNSKVYVITEIESIFLPHLDPRERSEQFNYDVGTNIDPMNEQK